MKKPKKETAQAEPVNAPEVITLTHEEATPEATKGLKEVASNETFRYYVPE